MDFPYIKVTAFYKHQKSERLLPWIRFGIYNPKDASNILFPLGLVDSGSEITFITHEFGEELGFDIKAGQKGEVSGVGGGTINIYYHKVDLVLRNKSKEICNFVDWMAFAYKDFPISMPQQTAILGTMGFFNHLNVHFQYPFHITISQNS